MRLAIDFSSPLVNYSPYFLFLDLDALHFGTQTLVSAWFRNKYVFYNYSPPPASATIIPTLSVVTGYRLRLPKW